MRKAVGAIVAVLAVGLWLFSAGRAQRSVQTDTATAQAQLTRVAGPMPSATP